MNSNLNSNSNLQNEIERNEIKFFRTPIGPLQYFMEDVCLDVSHLMDTYIVDNFSDMLLLKEMAKNFNSDVPNMIISTFDCEKYAAAAEIGLDSLPNVVANMFLDYAGRGNAFSDYNGLQPDNELPSSNADESSNSYSLGENLVEYINNFTPSLTVDTAQATTAMNTANAKCKTRNLATVSTPINMDERKVPGLVSDNNNVQSSIPLSSSASLYSAGAHSTSSYPTSSPVSNSKNKHPTYEKPKNQCVERHENSSAISSIESSSTILHVLLENPEEFDYGQKPSGIRHDTMFTLDMRLVSIDSAKCDDNGSYILNGNSKKYYLFNNESPYHTKEVHYSKADSKWYVNVRNGKFYSKVFLLPANVYQLKRVYRQSKNNPFQQIICTVQNVEEEDFKPYFMIIYKWKNNNSLERNEQFNMPRHGNATHPTAPAYFRTDPSFHNKIDKLLESGKSNDEIYVDLCKETSETMSETITSPKVVSNRKFTLKQQDKENNPISIFSEVEKIVKEVRSQQSLIRRVIFTEKNYCTINYTDTMINDLKRFCLYGGAIFLVDTTFEVAEGLWLTDTCYRNLSLKNKDGVDSPMFPGPSFWHFNKSRETYRRFALEIVMIDPELINLPKIGHDLDLAIAKGFKDIFINSKSVWCTQHMKTNDLEKLKRLGCTDTGKQRILADIYGSHQNVLMQSGLADANDDEDFDVKLESLRDIWQKIAPGFHRWFQQNRAEKFKNCLVLSARSSLGITERFTTNGLEIKHRLQKKKINDLNIGKDVKEVTDALHSWIKDNYYIESERALRSIGKYRLNVEFENFYRDPMKWNRYSEETKSDLITRFLAYIPSSYDGYQKPSNAGSKKKAQKRRVSEPEPEIFVERNVISKDACSNHVTPLKVKRDKSVWKVQEKVQDNDSLDDLLDINKEAKKNYQLIHRDDGKSFPKSVKRCQLCKIYFSSTDMLVVKTVGLREDFKNDGKPYRHVGNIYLHYAMNCLKQYDTSFEVKLIHVPKKTLSFLPESSADRLKAKGMILD